MFCYANQINYYLFTFIAFFHFHRVFPHFKLRLISNIFYTHLTFHYFTLYYLILFSIVFSSSFYSLLFFLLLHYRVIFIIIILDNQVVGEMLKDNFLLLFTIFFHCSLSLNIYNFFR